MKTPCPRPNWLRSIARPRAAAANRPPSRGRRRGLGVLLVAFLGGWATAWAGDPVLIVADEFPAMEVLAGALTHEAGIASQLVSQSQMPPDLARYSAVVVYLHKELTQPAEDAFIRYTTNGGRLVALHHSISSGKRTNENWFTFLGVDLPKGEATNGGYQWIEPVTYTLVSLATNHFITTNQLVWPEQTTYVPERSSGSSVFPALTLPESEVYLNHRLVGERTVLLGFKYQDARSGRVWMQDRAGWFKPAGKGWVFYFQAGHSAADFRRPAYARLLVNAVLFEPKR